MLRIREVLLRSHPKLREEAALGAHTRSALLCGLASFSSIGGMSEGRSCTSRRTWGYPLRPRRAYAPGLCAPARAFAVMVAAPVVEPLG